MTSKKLRKYLVFYQKTLREQPDNIEARLRLAAVYRDMGREANAIEEFGTASRLLARQGLALEAIAACKAILELDPRHTETQLFLARLYARVPDPNEQSARIARPLQQLPGAARSQTRREPLRRRESSQNFSQNVRQIPAQPLDLGAPKQGPEHSSRDAAHDEPTVVGLGLDSTFEEIATPDDARQTAEMDANDRATVLRAMYLADAALDEEIRDDDSARAQAELRRTIDVEEEDILLEEEAGGEASFAEMGLAAQPADSTD
jgi:hypothetical protein